MRTTDRHAHPSMSDIQDSHGTMMMRRLSRFLDLAHVKPGHHSSSGFCSVVDDVGQDAAAAPSSERAAEAELSQPLDTLTDKTIDRTTFIKRERSLSLPTVLLPTELQSALNNAFKPYSNKILASDGTLLAKYFLSRKVMTSVEKKRQEKMEENKERRLDEKRKNRENIQQLKKISLKEDLLLNLEEGLQEENYDFEDMISEDLPSLKKAATEEENAESIGEESASTTSPKKGSSRPGDVGKKRAKEGGIPSIMRYGRKEGIAYAASRLPADYGASLRVLSEIATREPSFKPETLMDFGSGVGSTVWAAHKLWKDSIQEYECVDVSREMCDVAMQLRTGGDAEDDYVTRMSKDQIPKAFYKHFLSVTDKFQFDVVTSSYALADIPSISLRRSIIGSLWRKAKHFLVFIEPGNWSGFDIITECRELILKEHAQQPDVERKKGPEQAPSPPDQNSLVGHVFAPCPHDDSCPLHLEASTPCFFAQRVQLALSQRNTPLKARGFYIEKFSYVVMRKGKRPAEDGVRFLPRVLQPIKKRTRHIICQLCCSNGKTEQRILTKAKHKEVYKTARRKQWGDMLPEHLGDLNPPKDVENAAE